MNEETRSEKAPLVFRVAKKLSRSGRSDGGFVLRSIKNAADDDGTRRVVMIVSTGGSEGNDRVKGCAAEYRARTGKKLYCKVRGKTMEISVPAESGDPAGVLMDFSAGLGFSNEDAADCVDFFNRHLGGAQVLPGTDIRFSVRGIEMDENSFSAAIETEACEAEAEERIYEALSSVLEEYDMGLIKAVKVQEGPHV